MYQSDLYGQTIHSWTISISSKWKKSFLVNLVKYNETLMLRIGDMPVFYGQYLHESALHRANGRKVINEMQRNTEAEN